MNTAFFKDFTNQYKLSKTLRFELIPQGKTLENIESKGLLVQDLNRASNYQAMKKTIDEYHKWFIDLALKECKLTHLDAYLQLYSLPKESRSNDDFNKVKMSLRKEIVKNFGEGKTKELFKNLFLKDLIQKDLEQWIKLNKPELFFDEGFKTFTTYFTGFHENRKNMYTAEEHSTGIAFRIVHENLPKFIDNINLFDKLSQIEGLDFSPILIEMEELIQGQSLEEIFEVEYFNNLLSQKGIDFFNGVVGGYSSENGIKIKGLNEYINHYNQKQSDKKKRVPKFKQLYKQILSDRESISFLPDNFSNDSELLDAVNNYYKSCLIDFDNQERVINVLNSAKEVVELLPLSSIDKIYLRNDSSLTNISQKLFGDFSLLKAAKSFYYETIIDSTFQTKISKPKLSEASLKKLIAEKENWNKDYISIALIQQCLDLYIKTLEVPPANYSASILSDYFKNQFNFSVTKDEKEKKYDYTSFIQEQYKGIEGMLNIEKEELHALKQDKEKAHQLKTFLDSIMNLVHFLKPLHCKDESITDKDELFYNDFNLVYQQLVLLVPLYNKVRNYVTQKPYETTKIKLNFENAQLLSGWDQNKETDNTSILLRKNGLYYLAIMNKKSNKVFEKAPVTKTDEAFFEKMNYKLLPGANKMLPKVFFSAKNIEHFNPSEEVLRIRNTAAHSKNGEPQSGFEKADFNLNDCHTLIDFFKASILKHEDWKHFDFQFSSTSSYQDISGFYREVEHQGYKINFVNIPEAYINEKVESGDLFLFQLYNKDFSTFSKGTPNMHTLYWKMLFDDRNLSNVIYKLNGEAEVFYRKASILAKNRIIHKKNEPIEAKNPLKPNKNTFAYDIIKDKRFTVDKFQFHIPITMNFKAEGTERINESVNKFLQNNPEVNIIGLDRGERHLIYLTLVNQKGEILKQESLNIIKDTKHAIETSYHGLLDAKELQREDARKEWGAIESIKELKEGYISQVVNKITTMMLEHNAIVVMEDLNFGFKRGRFHVEKQVYQKLEKMLIDKLNYLVLKKGEAALPGGVLNALQLSNKFESFQKMGKQMGFVFYVPAWNTSKIDPATGFVDFLKPKYENINSAKEFISKFKSISYKSSKQRFEFAFNYSDFTNRAEGSKNAWVVCANNETRYFFNRSLNQNKGAQESVNVAEAMENLFSTVNITYGNGDNIKEQIESQTSSEFFKKLLKLLSITLSLRHNNGLKGTEEKDFILSPVENENGEFYCSFNAPISQPQDADANGAYHIALKGLWVLNTLNDTEDLAKPKLAISNKQWLEFAQNKSYLK